MKNFILYLWQLPQNILGLLVIAFTGAFKTKDGRYWITEKGGFGVSLGNFIIFGDMGGRYEPDEKSIKHEQGHQKQSIILGWFYLLVVGIPSVFGNIWDRIAHQSWSHWKREQWYYSRFPENWADSLGGVKR